MKKTIIALSFIVFVLSAGKAFPELPSVNDNFTIHVPCAEYSGNNYELVFEAFFPGPSDSESSGAVLWKLISITEADPDGHCVKIQESSLNVIIPEIQYNQTNYSLSLHRRTDPETADLPAWQVGTLFELAPAEEERNTEISMTAQDMAAMVDGLNAFNIYFYKNIIEDGENLFYSPFSISSALAMAYAGAKGETAVQMKDALHFNVEPQSLHAGFNYLDLELQKRGAGAQGQDDNGFRLNISNNIWGQKGFSFCLKYLDTLSENYGAGLALLDFINEPENSRQIINAWVSDQTEGKINDLIPCDAIGLLTRLVLTNTIYFNAAWLFPFEPENTAEASFLVSETNTVTVPMMMQTQKFNYAESDDFQAVELFYDGGEMSMLIVLPRANSFSTFENNLNLEQVDSILNSLSRTNVELKMPLFKLEPDGISLKTVLQQMGMTIAFTESADFSGITGVKDLYISDVIHKAFINVDEAGTEAAAATAVIFVELSIPEEPVQMIINKPFIFMIRDIETKVILFMGRVVNP